MSTKTRCRADHFADPRCLCLLACLLLVGPAIKAQTLTWDANAGSSGQPNGSGQWLNANQWWNGTSNVAWDNSGSVIAQLGVSGSTAVSPNIVTITGGIVNVAGISFQNFASVTTGSQYVIAGSSGTLNFAADAIINVADNSSTGSNFITFETSLALTGSGLVIQKSGGTATQFMRFNMVSNPGLSGALVIKGNNGGMFVRSAAAGTFSDMTSVTVETDSCFSVVGGGTYTRPISIAGFGGLNQYGAIRVDTNNTTLQGPITLTADAGIQTNTGGVTGTIVSGGISGNFAFARFATGSGSGTLSFTAANTYTGATTLGRSGTFAGGVTILDFSASSAPEDDILYNGVSTPGTLNLVGGNNSSTVLQFNGKAGTVNDQRLGNLVLSTAGTVGGTAVLNLISGAAGQMNVSLGTLSRSASSTLLVMAPQDGMITTTQADGFLGPWATYQTPTGELTWARVTSGTITAFTPNLAHATGTVLSATPGYAAGSHLEITGTSIGNVTVGSGVSTLGTLTMSDHCVNRTVDLGGQTLRLGTVETGSSGGILLAQDAADLTVGVVGSAGTLTSGGPNTNNAGQLVLTNASSTSVLTINSVITNNGTGAVALVVNGVAGSKVVLANSNSFSGGTTIASGMVEIRNAGALGSSGTAGIMEGAALHVAGGLAVTRTFTVAGQGVSNTGAIRNLSGNNSFSAQLSLVAPTRFHADEGTLTLTHASGATTNILSGTHAVTFSGAGNHVVGSRMSLSTGSLTKEGTGMLTVSGDGGTSFTGTTTVSGGVLRFASGNALSTSTITVNENGTIGSALELTGGVTLANNITFNGSGINTGNTINGYGAIRNFSGSNTLSGTLGIGLDASGPRISADAGSMLTLSGILRSGASSAGTRFGLLGGAGTINVTGAITNGTTATSYITGITKIESGTVNLRAASSFTPNTTSPTTVLLNIRGGTFNLDYANATPLNGLVLGSNHLGLGGGVTVNGASALGGGTLLMTGKAAVTNTQNFAGTTLAGGRSAITVLSGTGGAANLALGPISRATSSGAAVNITLPANGGVTTTTLNTNGMLNGGITVGNGTWATSAATQSTNVAWANATDTITLSGYTNGTQVSFSGTAPGGLTAGVGYYVVNATGTSFQLAATEGGTALPLSNDGSTATMNTGGALTGLADASYSSSFVTNANVDVAGGAVSQGTITVNSLRFNASSGTTLSLSGTLTNVSGGLLVTPNVIGDVTIQSNSTTTRTFSNSTLSDFTVHHHGSGLLTIAPTVTLTNSVAITKTGPGTMVFAGTNSSAAVQIRATEGELRIEGSNRFTGTDPTLFIGSATTNVKVAFGNGSSTGSETLANLYVLGTGSSIVGNGSAVYTLGFQNGGTTDFRALMIGGAGTNENNLAIEGYSGGTLLLGGANTYGGRNNIGRSTFEARVIANTGMPSSLGTGSLSPDIVMTDTSSTAATVATLRYVGSASATTDRAVRLYTDGTTMPSLTAVIENNGAGTLKFTSPFTAGGNTTLSRTFRLSGSNAGINEIVSVAETSTSIVTLDKAGTGTWALTGTSTYTGGTTISNGTLQLGTGGTSGTVGAGDISIASGARLRTHRGDTVVLDQAITGAGSVQIANISSGTTVLRSNASTYTGGTFVEGGTLMIGNSSGSATGLGLVKVMSGATLAGMGRIAPSAGNSVTICGLLNVGDLMGMAASLDIVLGGSGALIIDSAGTLRLDLFSGAGAGDNTAIFTSSDRIRIGGLMQINQGSTLSVRRDQMSGTMVYGDAWRIIDWSGLSGVSNGTFENLDLPELDPGLLWDLSGLYTTGVIAVVPEPSRALLVGLGLGLWLLQRRRGTG